MRSSQEDGTEPKWWVELELYLLEDRIYIKGQSPERYGLEFWDAAFNMFDLGSSLAATKVKAKEVCQAIRKVEIEKSRKMKK